MSVDYLKTLSLTNALWWFIENVDEDEPHRNDMFFHLRERYRMRPVGDEYKSTTDLFKMEWAFKFIGVEYAKEEVPKQFSGGSFTSLRANDGQSWAFYFDGKGKYITSRSA